MNKRRIAHFVTFLCIAVAALLCVLLYRLPIFNPGRVYYHDNLVLNESDNYHATNSIGLPISESSDGRFSIGRFSGTQTISTLHIDEGESLSYTWDVAVERGEFKIVFADIQNARIVETVCEGSGSGSVNDCYLSAGEYRVKFVGDNANVEGKFSIVEAS